MKAKPGRHHLPSQRLPELRPEDVSTQPLNANCEILTTGPFFWQVIYANTSQHRVRQAAGSAQGTEQRSASPCRRHPRTGGTAWGPGAGQGRLPPELPRWLYRNKRCHGANDMCDITFCPWTESGGNGALPDAPQLDCAGTCGALPSTTSSWHTLRAHGATEGPQAGRPPRSRPGLPEAELTHRQRAPQTGCGSNPGAALL